MTLDWALPALRWALFADLGIVFGVPIAALVAGGRTMIRHWRETLAIAALAGIALGIFGFFVTVANMAAVAPSELNSALVLPLFTGTALGWALAVRTIALTACATLALLGGPARLPPLAMAGGVAVATLAWSGHAAASQGVAGWFRLGGDIVHLAGALCWVGALVLFVAMLWRPLSEASGLSGQLAKALSTFAFTGSVIVALLILTGVANLLFLVPVAELPQLNHSLYGRLLLIKLAAFLMMLGLAALNRFKLVPALEQAQHGEARLLAISRLRLSVSLELLAALAVLGLVAWLGTLDPMGIGN